MANKTAILGLAGVCAFALMAADGRAWAAGPDARPTHLAQNQSFAPPANVPDAGDQDNSDAAGLVLRVDRLEADLRRATGQIEQLENENMRLGEELRRFREDMEFRLGEGKAPPAGPSAMGPPSAAPPVIAAEEPPRPRKGDAFDPNADPNAEGAPRPLGSTQPSAPLSGGLEFKPNMRPPGPPMNLAGHVAEPAPAAPPLTQAPSGPLSPAPAQPVRNAEAGPTVINSGLDFADAPRNQLNAAIEAYKTGQYEFRRRAVEGVSHRQRDA